MIKNKQLMQAFYKASATKSFELGLNPSFTLAQLLNETESLVDTQTVEASECLLAGIMSAIELHKTLH